MADIPQLLLASLNPQTRKQAEQTLTSYSDQPGFLTSLLQLVLEGSQDNATRLAAAVYLKNQAKTRWLPEDPRPISDADKAALRPRLVPAMIALSAPKDKAVRAQIAESVSLIAEIDFPDQWPDLIDQLVSSLSPTDFNINTGVLETAHSIFRPWRSASRSDSLWSTINLVLSKILPPFHQLFAYTANKLLNEPPTDKTQLEQMATTTWMLVELFYDLTCQDLPPSLEDGHEEFFGSPNGHFMRLMAWDPEALRTDPDEATPSTPTRVRTTVLEVAEMYVKLYPEVLSRSASVEAFVRAVWQLVGGGTQLPLAYDPLVTQALRFISTAIRAGPYRDLFSARETIAGLVSGVVVPNVGLRPHDLEALEDTPLEFVRSDLATTEISTPRQAAADVVKALVSSGLEADATTVTMEWVNRGLAATGEEAWKSKDSAVFLFEALAARSGTVSLGVTATNALVDVVKFFGDNVFNDLQADPGRVHHVLQMDAIRYLHTFRNQLTKEQLTSVLPLLGQHLSGDDVVVYTYAAVAIDRILAIRAPGSPTPLFTYVDVKPFALNLIDILLRKVEAAGTPEKVAENDLVMRCLARVIITARQTLVEGYQPLLQRLVAVLGTISKNPSNPNFDQYIFESISALIRFVGAADKSTVPVFEQTLFGPFTFIIQQEIEQYIPYTFQILAQMLALHEGVPTEYRSLVPLLLTPASWTQKGSIPGLVRLLQAFMARDAAQIVASGQIESVLGIVQQRLIPSKLNDSWGFELLQAVVRYVPPSDLQKYFRGIVMTLLTRMQSSKTDSYVYHFVYFLSYTLAVPVDGLTPDFVVSAVESIQPGLWSNILTTFVVPQATKLAAKDRKVAVIGLTRLLTQSPLMLAGNNANAWASVFTAIAQLFREPQALKSSTADDAGAGSTEIDLEEQTAGYQAAYSRLAAADAALPDPAAHVADVHAFVGTQLQSQPQAAQLLQAADQRVVGPFVEGLRRAGYQF
ncbi:unnamed protein product [Peniophora sp. CBMAI 1063]|nr:unnamed protein product [Peniophora sp. CBMAI 1063]